MRFADEGAPQGAHFENRVLCDLLAWRDVHVPRAEVTYWRTAHGHEVDFVLELRRQLAGVEVKANGWLDEKVFAVPWWRVR